MKKSIAQRLSLVKHHSLVIALKTKQRFYHDNDAIIAEAVMAVVVSAVMLLVGIYIVAMVYQSFSAPTDANLSAVWSTITSLTANAFSLLGVGLIVLAAGVIITILMRSFRG